MHDLETTLVAVATPSGRGGVGCVRLSGPEAFPVARAMFRPSREGPEPGGRPRFGHFLGRDGSPIDHGYLVLFGPDGSFTGESTAEIWAHGSPAVLGEIVETAILGGAVAAGPGEFTYRALRHGRLDLARAEAVRDLVAARTLYQARVAFAQAEGSLSRRLEPLREALVDLTARIEAAVEFVDESDVHLPAGYLEQGIGRVREQCAVFLEGFRAGRVVREGATVTITGLPNVGKSSLFNRLLARDRAIVAASPGTTRDTLEDTMDLQGIPVRLIDTAGLRDVADPVEGEGVRRAREAREEADLSLLVLDGSRELEEAEREMLDRVTRVGDGSTLVLWNKSDLPAASDTKLPCRGAFAVSALRGDGLDELRESLRERLVGGGIVDDPILTDARHAQALRETDAALERALEGARGGTPEELVLEELREALRHLGEITGSFETEELYDRIFSTFCIGK